MKKRNFFLGMLAILLASVLNIQAQTNQIRNTPCKSLTDARQDARSAGCATNGQWDVIEYSVAGGTWTLLPADYDGTGDCEYGEPGNCMAVINAGATTSGSSSVSVVGSFTNATAHTWQYCINESASNASCTWTNVSTATNKTYPAANCTAGIGAYSVTATYNITAVSVPATTALPNNLATVYFHIRASDNTALSCSSNDNIDLKNPGDHRIASWDGVCGHDLTYGGKLYRTVSITVSGNTKCWFKDNVDYGMFRTNNASNVQKNLSLTNASSSAGVESNVWKYCHNGTTSGVVGNDNFSATDSQNIDCSTYGGQYMWHTALALPSACDNNLLATCNRTTGQDGVAGNADDGDGWTCAGNRQGICPTNWHIPSSTELTTYITQDNRTLWSITSVLNDGASMGWADSGAFRNSHTAGYIWNNENSFLRYKSDGTIQLLSDVPGRLAIPVRCVLD